MRKIFFLIIILINSFQSFEQIPTNSWRDHFSFQKIFDICQLQNGDIVGASDNGLMFFKKDGSISKFSKVNGLTDVGLSAMAYSAKYSKMIIAYKDGDIDIFDGKKVFNISDLKRKNISADKKINSIMIDGNIAYLSTGFGILKLNIEKNEIYETDFIGIDASYLTVYKTISASDSIFAATSMGLLAVSKNDDMVDYRNWTKINVPNVDTVFNLTFFSGKMYIIANVSGKRTLMQRNSDDKWSVVINNLNKISSLYASDFLYVANYSNLYILNDVNSIVKNIDTYNSKWNEPNILTVFRTKDGKLFLGDKYAGIVEVDGDNFYFHSLNGPFLNQVFKVFAGNDYVYCTRGGFKDNGSNLWRNGKVYRYDLKTNEWKIFSDYQMSDYNVVAIDKSDEKHFFVASWGRGVVEYDGNNEIAKYNQFNSPIESIIPNDAYSRISGLIYDDKKNLWVLNQASGTALNLHTNSGDWIRYTMNHLISGTKTGQMIKTSSDGNIWGILPDKGFFVLNYNNTEDNTDDDKFKILLPIDEDGKSIGTKVNCMAEDKSGDIWFGTNEGVGVFYSPQDYEQDDYRASRIKITALLNDSLVTNYLLSENNVLSIAVDGGNRKWFATENAGVFLMNSDGTKQLLHFTAQNSPLPSNMVYSVAIVPKTGEVFFATSKGLVSYMSDAADATDKFSNVYVYPNPVRHNYNGLITITGLAYNSVVKITDISGNIVYQANSNGAKVCWNGENFAGRRVATGVYLIFCATKNGKEKMVSKLLFIN
jgi:sugar lactone lactonase YvrE